MDADKNTERRNVWAVVAVIVFIVLILYFGRHFLSDTLQGLDRSFLDRPNRTPVV